MQKIIIDEVLRNRLHDFADQIELCDEAGQTLGHFLPAGLYRTLLYSTVKEPNLTVEDIERRLQQPGGRSLAEIWKSLGRT